MTTATRKFEIGKTYVVQSRCDRVFFKVVARTVKTATFELIGTQHDASRFDEMHIDIAGNGETQKVRLRTDDGVEFGTVEVEAQNAWGVHFTDRVNIEPTGEVQVSIAAEIALASVDTNETVNATELLDVDEYAVTPEALDAATDAEIELATVTPVNTVDTVETVNEPTEYWAKRAKGNYNLDINGEYVIFKNHSIVYIDAIRKLGYTYSRGYDGKKRFYDCTDPMKHKVISAKKIADIFLANEQAAEQTKIFPAFFKPYQYRPTGEFTIWVILTYADGSEHHFRGEFNQYRLAQKFIADVKTFAGDVPCQFVTKTRDHSKDEKPAWEDPHKYEAAGNLDASHYLAVRYNYLHDEKTNQPDDIANLCVINGQKVSADEYIQLCKDLIASNEPIRVEAWFGMKKALAADDYETHDDWLDDYCDADAIIQECLANIKTVTGVTVPDDKSYLDNEFCLEKQTADNPTDADDFMTKLTELEAEKAAAKAKADEARIAYEFASDAYDEKRVVLQNFLDEHALRLSKQLETVTGGMKSWIELYKQSSERPLEYSRFDVTRVDVFNAFGTRFIIQLGAFQSDGYDTPAQVERVINLLKDAIARGDKEFTFPTVDELKTPPPTVDDKLGRAMETALLKCQEQCRNGNINAALAELKIFAICRDAARELNTLPELDFTPLPKRITAYHDDTAIIAKVEDAAIVRTVLVDELNKKIADIEDDISFNQRCFDETADSSTLDAELRTLITNGGRLIKQRDKLLAHVNYLNGILDDVILNNADLEQKIA